MQAMFAASLSLGLALLPSVFAAVHDVQVGGPGGKLEFSPEAISAQPGDQVVFHFNPKNHTVTQSSFANPCGLKDGGFNSGFQPVSANQTDNFPTYTISINDTQPVWVFCAQAANTPASHCGQGMVFAVNCGLDGAPNSFTNFKNSALAIGASLAAAASTSSTAVVVPSPTSWTTAAYGDYTIPPAPTATPVTQAITLGSEIWTTTYSSYPNSPAPTPASADGQIHKVIVGGPGKLTFDPPSISAQPRDVVVFEFHQKNHTVTQSSFADPCRKLDGGFDSNFFPVADNATDFPTWNFTVTDTSPVWAYCRQTAPTSHCGAGMVFAINADDSSARNFTAFQNVAKALNGTSAADNSVPSSTGTSSSNGAIEIFSSHLVLATVLGLTSIFLLS